MLLIHYGTHYVISVSASVFTLYVYIAVPFFLGELIKYCILND